MKIIEKLNWALKIQNGPYNLKRMNRHFDNEFFKLAGEKFWTHKWSLKRNG